MQNHCMDQGTVEGGEIARFLTAWFAVRQVIQAANFNHFQKAGLSATQFMTLNLLPAGSEGIAIGELARRMNLKAATVAKTVDSLQSRRLLKRTRGAADRRLVLVSITKRGRTLQNAAVGQFRLHVTRIFNAMPGPDRVALIEGLESLVRVAAATAEERVDPPAKRSSRRSQPR